MIFWLIISLFVIQFIMTSISEFRFKKYYDKIMDQILDKKIELELNGVDCAYMHALIINQGFSKKWWHPFEEWMTFEEVLAILYAARNYWM
jgi:hypothetical protein